MIPDSVRALVAGWGQSQILQYVDSPAYRAQFKITDDDVLEFVNQIESVDFPRVEQLLKAAKQGHGEQAVYSPPLASEIFMRAERTAEQEAKWWGLGMEAIRAGKVAVTILAGGQGTRMGLAFDESKGMLCLEKLPSQKFVFQLFIERLARLQTLAQAKEPIPLLIMTSPINHEKVSGFLKSHKFFGHKNVRIFSQGTLPALTTEGNLLLESHARLAISPDGNGGVYNALVTSGTMAELHRLGVEHLHVIAVDNAIARPGDPLFIGACIAGNVEIGNKVVWKSDWKEKVGVIAKRDGKNSVVEYSDLFNPDLKIDNPMIRATDEHGRLLFGAGNICNHYYSIKGLDKILPKVTANYHLAVKKITSVDPKTHLVSKPVSNNGLKLESFIFDAFELATSSIIVEASREEEFSPMKNPDGPDSPESAVEQMRLSHRKWLKGAKFANENVWVEITPEISYAGEGLEGFAGVTFSDPKTVITKEWVKSHLQ